MNEDWIETNGVRPDLPDGTLVHTKYGGGSTSETTRPAGIRVEERRWELSKLVVAYKLATPAKAAQEPTREVVCGCGKAWRAWSGKSNCTCGAIIEFDRGTSSAQMPRWVRCSDRLPADGKEYRGRFGTRHFRKVRMLNGHLEFQRDMDGLSGWECQDRYLRRWEWLDEAPAQEIGPQCPFCGSTEDNHECGRIVIAPTKGGDANVRPYAADAVTGDGASVTTPYGYLSRAKRHQRAEAERVAEKMTFFNRFGHYSPF